MSTNTTSTSDRIATDSPTSSSVQEEGAQKYEGVSPFAGVPDAAAIARLANEFFAALPLAPSPAAAVSGASPNEVDLRTVAGGAPRANVPDYPREMFSFPATPNPPAVAGLTQPPSSPPSGVLNEADFRAIAASLAGATRLVPQVSAAAPQPATAVSPSNILDGQKIGPWATAPKFPSTSEMYSFPGVPAMPTSAPTAPPSGSDAASVAAQSTPPITYPAPIDSATGGRTDPWAAAPNFPGQSDAYSFPRAPGASVPGAPEVLVTPPCVPASQPSSNTIPASPVTLPTNATESLSGADSAPLPAVAPVADDSVDAGRSVYGVTAPKFPSVSEIFSFPGAPGAQSPPGIPVLPSSAPTKTPTEADIRALPAPLAGSSASTAQLPTIARPAVPGASGSISDPEGERPRAGSLPQDIEAGDFRPDVV